MGPFVGTTQDLRNLGNTRNGYGIVQEQHSIDRSNFVLRKNINYIIIIYQSI